ncbi:hypothetical protein HHK36_014842 [Tetracentron sinense]|uniref:GTD-binding domain-containing protein n=1 Tax=Tetracentron sinense TaxID=13715 RepID=A0A834Z9X2_TETSI|nr:hypothetical protein HHK36_014842 [Tetracentron sinense]
MAANKFATMLHRNTHKMTLILVYAVLEWILILLLLLNSLFSYLIAKFAEYFGLKPPCLWCSRVDHIFEPGKSKNSYRDLVCENHASEISKLGYCSNHRKLVEAQDMCEDCSSSRPNYQGNSIDITRKIAFFPWMKEMGMMASDGEKKIENGEKNSRCSCCDVSLSSKFYSPYLLFKPSWGVLDYTQKGNLITAPTSDDNDGGEYTDPCKSDCPTDRCDDDHEIEKTRGAEEYEDEDDGVAEEHQIPSDVDEGVHGGDEADEDCSRSLSNFPCNETVDNGGENSVEENITEQEFVEEEDSDMPMEGKNVVHQSSDETIIQFCSREDESLEIFPLHLDNFADHDDRRLVPVELIDFMTAENQRLLRCREEDQGKHDHQGVLGSELHIEAQIDSVLEMENDLREEESVFSVDEDVGKTRSMELESMEMDENEISSVIHGEDSKSDFVVEVFEQVTITQANQNLSIDCDDVEAAAIKDPDDLPASEEDGFKLFGDETKSEILIETEMSCQEPTDQPRAHELIPSLSCREEDQSSMNNNYVRNYTSSDTFMAEDDQGPRETEESTIQERTMSVEGIEQRINHHLSLCSELNEVEEEKAPETPVYIEGLYQLQRKLLLFEKRESGAEESLDGSVVSEIEGGEGVLTIERLKSALKAERKALGALYTELEEERSASAIAANQTMAMITRLQEEKAAMQMEALQYQRMMDEQSEYDQEALQLLNELMVKREKEKQELEKELEMYRKKVLDYEAKEKKMMRRKASIGRSRTSSASSSNPEDSDEVSIDLNHEGRDEEILYSNQESSNHNTPADAVLNLETMGQECAKHLSTLDESLADFEEERQSILEQLKALEEKLFTLSDDDDEEEFFEDVKPNEIFLEENGKEFNGNCDFRSREVNGDANGFSEDMSRKHYQERKIMGSKAKTLLPLFDAIGMETEDGVLNEEQREYDTFMLQNSSVPKFALENKKVAIEEEVDHVYERLQALEADREFLKHCISSLKKGDKGMDLLQEILQHLRDLRTVELRVKNIGDGALL